MFCTHRAFPVFASLAVFWRPFLGPCAKSIILTSVSKT